MCAVMWYRAPLDQSQGHAERCTIFIDMTGGSACYDETGGVSDWALGPLLLVPLVRQAGRLHL